MRRFIPSTRDGWGQVFFGMIAVALLGLGLRSMDAQSQSEAATLPAKFDISGKASVHDGDSLNIHGTKVRLWGIDAPELQQSCQQNGKEIKCGVAAREGLKAIIADQPVRCVKKDISYDRMVAQCFVGQVDVAQAVIRRGLAISEWYHSKAPYQADEKLAKSDQVGLWAVKFQKPSQWRLCNLPQYAAKRPKNCNRAFHSPKGP